MYTKEQLEKMGRNLACDVAWNGDQVLIVAIEALTDANFHAEAKVLQKMLDALLNSDDTPEYNLIVVTDTPASTATTLSNEPVPTEQKPAPPQGG